MARQQQSSKMLCNHFGRILIPNWRSTKWNLTILNHRKTICDFFWVVCVLCLDCTGWTSWLVFIQQYIGACETIGMATTYNQQSQLPMKHNKIIRVNSFSHSHFSAFLNINLVIIKLYCWLAIVCLCLCSFEYAFKLQSRERSKWSPQIRWNNGKSVWTFSFLAIFFNEQKLFECCMLRYRFQSQLYRSRSLHYNMHIIIICIIEQEQIQYYEYATMSSNGSIE